MAIVSCPECGKKLKIADASVGKKVKGPCGHVFVAQGDAAPAAKPAPAVAPEKVFVGCTECGAKLKVATTSLGKKMKCPKCSAVFVASLPDEEPAPPPKAKAKPAVSDDDMDDLLSFAQADAANGKSESAGEDMFKDEPVKSRAQRKMDEDAEADADEPKPKGKAKPKPMDDEDDDDEPMPKGKKPSRFGKESEPAKPVYPSRLLPNILVTLMVLAFGGLVGAIFFEVNIAQMVGIPEPKPVRLKGKGLDNTGKDKEPDSKAKEAEAANKKEMALLDGVWFVASADTPEGPVEALKGKKYVFADGKVTTPDAGQGPFSVDASQDPKWISLHAGPKAIAPGVYELKGDTLRWRVAGLTAKALGKGKEIMVPGPRPTKLDAAEGTLVVLTREKKAETTEPPETKKDALYDREASQMNLKEIGLALHGYHDKNKTLPPTGISDAAGKPLLSWRVAILPYLGPEAEALYKEFDLDQPWDSPQNKELIAKMPQVFVVPVLGPKEGMTHYRTLVGPGTPLEPMKGPDGMLIGRKMVQITDGTSNTIVVVEAKDPTIWTKPDDLPYDPAGPLPKFGVAPAGFNVLFLDARTEFIRPTITEKVLRPYLTGNNGIPREPLDKKGKDDVKGKDDPEAKINAAKAQINVLTQAVQAYRIKNAEYPPTLAVLLDKDAVGGPYLESKDALIDPWKKPFQYDAAGPKNNGTKPDIWTVTPDKVVIGNWPAVKEKAKDKDGDDLEKTLKKLGGRAIFDDKQPGKPVIGASFDGAKITDADLKMLAGFKQLRKLNLGSTKIKGAGLKDLALLENLEELDLNFTLLDDEGVKELPALKNLKVLSAVNVKITDDGLKVIVQLTQLEELNVSQNFKLTSAAITELKALKELRRLDLGNTNTGDDTLKVIGEFDKLEKLNLVGTLITDEAMKDVAKLKNLQDLSLNFNISDKGMKHLAELTELRKLFLSFSMVKDDSMKIVGGFTKLTRLYLENTGVSDAALKELAALKQLEDLNLTGTQVTDPGLKSLEGLTNLRFLLLRNTKVSAEAVAELKKSLPKCQVFHK